VLLLVTIGLVLVGAVSLVIGFLSNALPWIYVSIVCSVIAAAVLVLFSRMSRVQPAAGGGAAGPAPLADSGEPTLAGAGAPPTEAVVVPEAVAAVVAFPIGDYDSLKVNEIVPKLSGLGLDQLDAVREREAAGKSRSSVLSRIDERIAALEAEDAAAAAAPAATAAGGNDDSIDDLIEDYDQLSVNQILPLLGELDEDELEDVAAYEEDHKNRASVLDRIDSLLEGEAPAPAPAKKSAAKKTAAPAKKSAVKKAAAPAKKTAAKKSAAPAKKAAAPAKKAAAPAKKAAVKKAAAPAKKTAVKKSAAPAKKTAARKR
jgi:hypothetical protein